MRTRLLAAFSIICLITVLNVRAQQRVRQNDAGDQGNLADDVRTIVVDAPKVGIKPASSQEPFTINATFSANVTPAQQAVFQEALNEWRGIILTRGLTPPNYPISFTNGPLATLLGNTTTTFDSDGNLISASITFDNDGSTTWYIDPTPATDTEFAPPAVPPPGFDLLSVARHELGHAVGWTGSKYVKDATNSNNIFDPIRLNIAMTLSGGTHTDPNFHVNDLMVPSIGASTRRPISLYPDAAMLARVFQYGITMGFVDGNNTDLEVGSANFPWNTVKEGIDFTPPNFGLLLIPGIYHEQIPLQMSKRLLILTARGGNAVIKQ
jgi:hypothetical protein